MATSQSYLLNGPTTFPFPFGVRVPSDLTLTLSTGGIVSPAAYAISGTGSASVAVVVTYPTAPTDGSTLTITRRTPFTQVSTFSNNAAVTGSAVNAEFENVYRGLGDNTLSLGFDPPVQWTPFTPYTANKSTVFATVGAVVGFYTCNITHTSPAMFVASPNWTFITDLTSLIQAGLNVVLEVSAPYTLPVSDPVVVFVAPNDMDISDQFVTGAEQYLWAQVPATVTTTLPVFIDSTQIATITFAAGQQVGTIVRFSIPPGGRFFMNRTSRVRIIGPAVTDATLSGIGIMLKFRLVLV